MSRHGGPSWVLHALIYSFHKRKHIGHLNRGHSTDLVIFDNVLTSKCRFWISSTDMFVLMGREELLQIIYLRTVPIFLIFPQNRWLRSSELCLMSRGASRMSIGLSAPAWQNLRPRIQLIRSHTQSLFLSSPTFIRLMIYSPYIFCLEQKFSVKFDWNIQILAIEALVFYHSVGVHQLIFARFQHLSRHILAANRHNFLMLAL